MPNQSLQWQIQPTIEPPEWFTEAVKQQVSSSNGRFVAQLLWQRGIQNPDQLAGFLNPKYYKPSSPFAFGQEMQFAIARLQQAYTNRETVAIWGDFDADGVTATSVLWDGLGQFFVQQKTLFYYIPNRLTESHGLSRQGLIALSKKGCRLIVTCDTGSTNLDEIEYARSLGMDVIVTDHHTLPAERPPVTAIINPRYLSANHPLATLSGVAVAYKLVEALYEALPQVPQKPLEHLLDLVAIGLIADLVELKGDCRYLAQLGIEQLQKQSNGTTATRPGVAKLLEFCKRSGDRPTDISFGLGPRINAVSRIHGDAHFCVELLTSQDAHLCTHLAEATELANTRRKALQKDVAEQVTKRLAQLDLSTTSVIVLADEQWQVGVLGLVAGQIAQEYSRPTILLSTEGVPLGGRGTGAGSRASGFGLRELEEEEDAGTRGRGDAERTLTTHNQQLTTDPTQNSKLKTQNSFPTADSRFPTPVFLARGSARSVNNIDLYQLVKDQAHLLTRFGGHPFAAGLSLPIENLSLFTEGINQRLRQSLGLADAVARLEVDLTVTVKDLGKDLFQELKLLEPCGIGNPVPKLLIQNCWFENVWNRKIQDRKGQKIEYIKTEFELCDDSTDERFPGVWWGHYRDEIPKSRCDVVVELDFNTYANAAKGIKPHYEVRLVAIQPRDADRPQSLTETGWILDWRQEVDGQMRRWGDAEIVQFKIQNSELKTSPLLLRQCPGSWGEFQVWFRRSRQEQRPLAIAYPPPSTASAQEIWQQLVGIVKYLSRTGRTATRQQVLDKLQIGDRALQLGFRTLPYLGFTLSYADNALRVTWRSPAENEEQTREAEEAFSTAVERFFVAVREEQFRRQYFYQVPLTTIQAVASQTSFE